MCAGLRVLTKKETMLKKICVEIKVVLIITLNLLTSIYLKGTLDGVMVSKLD